MNIGTDFSTASSMVSLLSLLAKPRGSKTWYFLLNLISSSFFLCLHSALRTCLPSFKWALPSFLAL